MKKRQIIILVALLTVALSVSACGCLSGGKTQEKAAPAPAPTAAPTAAPAPAPTPAPAPSIQSGTPTTAGKELMDLNKAREQGAITDEEYQRAKAKLLGEQPAKTEQKAGEEKETTK
jgi:hypothetical protein